MKESLIQAESRVNDTYIKEINNMSDNTSKTPELKASEAEIQKDPRRKREIIKNILIVFLIILLILTFFSNTIMNRSLPEVTSERALSGKLTERVRGTGMIESNQSYKVTLDEARKIDTILIKSGQRVEKDDVLFTVRESSAEDIAAEEKTLSDLEFEYQKLLLADPLDYSEQNQAIKNAREDLNLAIQARDKAYAAEQNATQIKANSKNAKNEVTRLTNLQTKLSTTISALDEDNIAGASPEYTGDLMSIYNDYASADAEYKAAYEIYSQAMENGSENVDIAKADADAKEAEMRSRKSYYNDSKAAVRSSLVDQLNSVNNDLASATALAENYAEQLEDAGSVSYETAAANVIEKQRALENLIIALNKQQVTDQREGQVSNLTIDAKKQEVEKQREKVKKLKDKNAATEVKSKYSGVVSSIDVKPDDSVGAGDQLAVIDLDSEGYTVKISVETEKAKKVKVGASADPVNYWGGNIEATLKEIKNDPNGNSKMKQLVFSLSGDVESGSSLELSIPCGSGNYDSIIPKGALGEDTKGKFVLKIRSKNTPLGNRYYAERVDVEVKASDDNSYAVSGNIGSGDYLITASSKPVEPGDQVRMPEKS